MAGKGSLKVKRREGTRDHAVGWGRVMGGGREDGRVRAGERYKRDERGMRGIRGDHREQRDERGEAPELIRGDRESGAAGRCIENQAEGLEGEEGGLWKGGGGGGQV